jgi:hypothetical protein
MKPNNESERSGDLCNYEDVAGEIERVAEMVRKRPALNHRAAERLHKIAEDIRSDIDRMSRDRH